MIRKPERSLGFCSITAEILWPCLFATGGHRKGVLQRAAGWSVCQCHVFSGSRSRRAARIKGRGEGALVHRWEGAGRSKDLQLSWHWWILCSSLSWRMKNNMECVMSVGQRKRGAEESVVFSSKMADSVKNKKWRTWRYNKLNFNSYTMSCDLIYFPNGCYSGSKFVCHCFHKQPT